LCQGFVYQRQPSRLKRAGKGMQEEVKGFRIRITGIVQGVGFRPHVYRLACENGITGWVLNSSSGVLIEAEGRSESLRDFARRLVAEPPPLAVIKTCEVEEIDAQGFAGFTIRHSQNESEKAVMISPDIAVCPDCKREVTDPEDRRYRYPFTNCTNCGPRFTIIKDVPYDRDKTTMAPFPMCEDCRREYEDPRHRRFHAQPNACPSCGPKLWVWDDQGQEVGADPIELLKRGYIVAVKGLGGFHLAADAKNHDAVRSLRHRKKREAKPFAVMARDIEAARRYCHINPVEEQWLTSPAAPIVILERNWDGLLPDELIHPGIDTIGVMLPYTPLHYLLFDGELDLLIMTSANITDEPLIIDNSEALFKLRGVADYFIVHDREIYNPCDDSVMRVTPIGTPQFVRRARGFVPRGIKLPGETRPVLALGGELKNTFCMTRGDEAFLSQHWGDLNNYSNWVKFVEGIPRFKRMLAVEPEVIAHDMHPDYQTTIWALKQEGVERVAIQHHYAHLASCMAENGLEGEALGLVCDGTGWGTDGAIWGFEFLKGDRRSFTRLGHLRYVPLPGGDATSKRPYRMALVYLLEALGDQGCEMARRYLPAVTEEEIEILGHQVRKRGNVMRTSSCGRLFDAVSAFLGVCYVNRYEGQAAVELEAVADTKATGCYPYFLERQDGVWQLDVLPMWAEMMKDRENGKDSREMAMKFHLTLVAAMTDALNRMRDDIGLEQVVLSGGVFHNQILLEKVSEQLREQGFQVYQHTQVPPGDGGISLGQAYVASEVKR